MFEMSIDVHDEDIDFIKSPMASPSDLHQHLSCMISDNRRKAEVNIRGITAEELKLIVAAHANEVDQWISISVFKRVRRAGIPIKRIMAMLWILT